MAIYKQEEFVREVLIELGVLDATEAPEAEDSEHVSRRMAQKFSELYDEGLIPFDIDGDIPGRYFLPLVALVAVECATSYGVPLEAVAIKAAAGNRSLWKLRQKPHISTPAQADYF